MKRIAMILSAIATVLVFASSSLAADLTIVGTGDGVAVLKSIAEAYKAGGGEVGVVIPDSIGSGGGIKAVGADEAKIARVARKLKEKEAAQGLTHLPYAKIPVSIFVHADVKVDNLSAAQVVDIYAGKITDWSAVGGAAGKIRVIRREDGDSSLDSLIATFPGFKDLAITEQSKTAQKTNEMVELMRSTPSTIGFGPMDVGVANGLKAVKIDGKAPGEPGYPTASTLAFVFKEANLTGDLKKFVDFATSPAAAAAIAKVGGQSIK